MYSPRVKFHAGAGVPLLQKGQSSNNSPLESRLPVAGNRPGLSFPFTPSKIGFPTQTKRDFERTAFWVLIPSVNKQCFYVYFISGTLVSSGQAMT